MEQLNNGDNKVETNIDSEQEKIKNDTKDDTNDKDDGVLQKLLEENSNIGKNLKALKSDTRQLRAKSLDLTNNNDYRRKLDDEENLLRSTLIQQLKDELNEINEKYGTNLKTLEQVNILENCKLCERVANYEQLKDENSLLRNKCATDQKEIDELKKAVQNLKDQLKQSKEKHQVALELEQGQTEDSGNLRVELSSCTAIKLRDENSALQNESTTLQKELHELKEESEKHLTLMNKLELAGDDPRDDSYDELIKEYDLAIESCPSETDNFDKAIFLQIRAAIHDHHQRWSMVINDCSAALAFDRTNLKALVRRAKAYELHQRELAKSLEDIMTACILEEFQNESTLTLAKRVLKALSQKHAKQDLGERQETVQPGNFFVKIYCASVSEDFTKTGLGFDQLEGNVQTRDYMDPVSYDDIIAAYSKVLETKAEFKVQALLVRATFYLLMDRYAETSADLDAIIGSEQADKNLLSCALVMRAKLTMKTEPNNPDKWFQIFGAAEQMDPQNGDIYFHRALAYMEIERVSEAVSDFEEACSLNRSNSIFQIHRYGAIYRQALINKDEGTLRKMLDDFRNELEQQSVCADNYILMAQALYDRKNFQEADKVTKLDPDYAQRMGCKALLQDQSEGNIDQAIDLIKRALRVDDSSPFAYEALGMAQVPLGQLERAIGFFDCAIKIANTEAELTRLYKLKSAVVALLNVTERMGLDTKTRILDILLDDMFAEM